MTDQVLADDKLVSNAGGSARIQWLLADEQQTPRKLLEPGNSTPLAEFTYDSFGKLTSATTPAAVDLLFGHAGGEFDVETGLTKHGVRYYNPTTGRFLSEDPANADVDPYRYANNNPINNVDPTGLYSIGNSGGFSAARSIIDSTVGSPFAGSSSSSLQSSLLFGGGSTISPSSYGSGSIASGILGWNDYGVSQNTTSFLSEPSIYDTYSSRYDSLFQSEMADWIRPQSLPIIVAMPTPQPINDPIGRFLTAPFRAVGDIEKTAVKSYHEVRGQGGSVGGSLYTGLGAGLGGFFGVENIENARSGRDAAGNQLGPLRRTFDAGLGVLSLLPFGKGASKHLLEKRPSKSAAK